MWFHPLRAVADDIKRAVIHGGGLLPDTEKTPGVAR